MPVSQAQEFFAGGPARTILDRLAEHGYDPALHEMAW